MTDETKEALGRLARICRNNIDALDDYNPHYPNGRTMTGAKAEVRGVCYASQEILDEIRAIRFEGRKRRKHEQ